MSYFNTTNLKNEKLKEAKTKARSQEALILKYFRWKKKPLSPSDIWHGAFDPNKTPLTSVRRAMTVLTNDRNLLMKTDKTKKGIYGNPEYLWELRSLIEY